MTYHTVNKYILHKYKIVLLQIMVQKIKIDWRNCYGIKELNQEFQFTSGKQIHLIYAPKMVQ